MLPARISSPGRFSAGTLSPVSGLASTDDCPSPTTPSTGTFLPGLTRTRSPTRTWFVSTATSCAVAEQPAFAGKDFDEFVDAALGASEGPCFQAFADNSDEDDLGGDKRLVDQDRRDAGQRDGEVSAQTAGKQRIEGSIKDACPAQDRREQGIAIAEELVRPGRQIGAERTDPAGNRRPKIAEQSGSRRVAVKCTAQRWTAGQKLDRRERFRGACEARVGEDIVWARDGI